MSAADALPPAESDPAGNDHSHPRAQLALAVVWGAIVLALIVIVTVSIKSTADIATLIGAAGDSDRPAQVYRNYFSDRYEDIKSTSFFQLWLAAWALAALVGLAAIVSRRTSWLSLRGITWLILCAITVAGFPLCAALCPVLSAALGLVGPSFWLVALRILVTPLMLPLAGLASIFALVSGVSLLTAGLVFLVVGLPIMIGDWLTERGQKADIRRQKQQQLLNHAYRFRLWLDGKSLPPAPPDDSKGARFATLEEAQRIHNAAMDQPARMAFGRLAETNPPFFANTEKHVLIMASTRSGKGVTLIIPHLLRHPGSAFVLDPKGENARATGRQRAAFGKVHVLDPFGISGKPRSRFNPLARFTPENMEAESKALAAALFLVGDKERDHWSAAGQQLLALLILYVVCSPRFDRESRDLIAVRRILLTEMDARTRPALEDMLTIDDADGMLSDLAQSFLGTPEKEFGSIVSSAQRQTEILDNPYLGACLAASGLGDEVDFKLWHSGIMTVFLCLSATKFPTFNRWLRLVLTSALDEMTDRLDPPKLPVCFMLDELATLGHMVPVENAIGLAAGYGVQLVTVFQDVAQMRELYRGRWASFIGNAGIRALFNLDDFETAEYWSKFIGGRLVETRSRQDDIYGYSKGDNIGESMRPLLAPDQLMMELANDKMLVLIQGAHPLMNDRVPYWKEPSLDGRWDDPRPPAKAVPTPPKPPAPPPTSPPASPTPPASPKGGGGPRPSTSASPAAASPQPAPAYGSGSAKITVAGQLSHTSGWVQRDPRAPYIRRSTKEKDGSEK